MEETHLSLALVVEDISQKEPEMKVQYVVVAVDVEANVAFVKNIEHALVKWMDPFQCLVFVYLEPQAETVGYLDA